MAISRHRLRFFIAIFWKILAIALVLLSFTVLLVPFWITSMLLFPLMILAIIFGRREYRFGAVGIALLALLCVGGHFWFRAIGAGTLTAGSLDLLTFLGVGVILFALEDPASAPEEGSPE
ncbi:hypothetical protein KQI84_06250 [bacterium]|nr:hypothetical protein [bacterium]